MTLVGYSIAIAFLAGLVLVPLMRAVALSLDVVARPRTDRWHREKVPLLGGSVIAVVVLGLAWILPETRALGSLLVCAGLMALLGLIDDLYDLKSSTKLVFQIMVAAMFVYAGARLGWTNSLTLDTLLTLLWLVGITNALNLLDNMDGLAAGVACIAAISLLAAMAPGFEAEALVLAMVLGASAAFLWFNSHPASVFMGDTGSLFLGFLLAATCVSAGASGPRELLSVVAAPVLVLFIPIFDTTFVLIARVLSGRPPSQGGRDHSSHRLVAMGLSERWAVLVLWTLAAVGGVIGVLVRHLSTDWAGVLAGIFVLTMAIFAAYLSGVRVYDDANPRTPPVTLLLTEVMHKRRVLEVLLDFALICVSYYCAYRLRFDRQQFSTAFATFLQTIPVVIAVQLAAQYVLGAYRGMWRYFGLMDAVVFAKSVTVGTLAVAGLIVALNGRLPVPQAVFVIYATVLLLLLTASRASFRLMSEFVIRRTEGRRTVVLVAHPDDHYVVQRLAIREGRQARRLIGFFVPADRNHHDTVNGYPSLGDYEALLEFVAAGLADEVIVSVPGIEDARLVELEQHCRVHRVDIVRFDYTLRPVNESSINAGGEAGTARG